MKYIILIAILFLTLNCALQEPVTDLSNWDNLRDDQIPNELKKLNWDYKESYEYNIAICFNWCVTHIDYKLYANGFHDVSKTFEDSQGNCANLSLSELNLISRLSNYKVKGNLVYCWNKLFNGLHYTIMVNGYYPEKNRISIIYEIISYDNIANYILYRQ
jgi:hypothetical protein